MTMSDVSYEFTRNLASGDMFGTLKSSIVQGVTSVRDIVTNTADRIKSSITGFIDKIKSWWNELVETKPWIPALAAAAALLTAPIWIPLIPALAMRVWTSLKYLIRLPFVLLGLAR